jgi:bifunctional UDP-N-acetylglucosamine pyrophosphorylase / glucosamine-1-phosphate N-acetyltransferase
MSSTNTSAGERFAVAIMAAGKGTRLKSKHPKVLHRIGGKTLLEHVIDAARQVVPVEDIYAIIGHEADAVHKAVGHTGVRFVLQTPQLGTGHAILTARQELERYNSFLVLSGDVPLVSSETIRRVIDFHREQNGAMTILTAEPADPTGYGRVMRKGPSSIEVQSIVEQKALNPGQAFLAEINSGIYAFQPTPLYEHMGKLTTDNPHRELYLTDMAAILGNAGQRVICLKAADANEVLGTNTRQELAQLDSLFRARKCVELMNNGVTIYKPETCVIDAEVEIGPDTIIEPFVQLLGKTRIGSDCLVRSYSVITDCELADKATVNHCCIMQNSRVATDAIIGPYSRLRPESDICEGAHVGNFVEIKKTRLGRGSKANHLTYLGDAVIGEGANIGAGTITCNYDGVQKHRTEIGDGAFIGSDSTLVAPIKIAKGAYVGAAACITQDVPEDALALSRAPQVIKEDWAKRRREKLAAAKSTE